MKNYYRVLGVEPDATPEQIRSAYRKKAKGLHPDRAGGACEPFQAIQEAYEVLGDPARRQAHDDQLAGEVRTPHPRTGVKPEPLRRGRWSADPLFSRRQPTGPEILLGSSPLRSLIEEFLPVHPVGPWPAGPPTAGSPRRIILDICLTPDEAHAGGRLRSPVPVRVPCRRCGGRGHRGFFACPLCQGRGILDAEYTVEIIYPAGIPDRSIWTVALRQTELDATHLVLRFRISKA